MQFQLLQSVDLSVGKYLVTTELDFTTGSSKMETWLVCPGLKSFILKGCWKSGMIVGKDGKNGLMTRGNSLVWQPSSYLFFRKYFER